MNNQWLQYGPTSNKFRQSYIKGFLDVSGTAIIRNGSLQLLDGDISMNGNLLISGSNITNQLTDTSNNLSSFQTRVDTSLNTVFNNLETTDTSLNTLTTTVSYKRDSSDLVFNGTTQLGGHIIPTTTGIYDIGTTSKRFRSIYVDEAHLSANTLYIGDTPILGTHSNTIQIKADENQSIDIITTGSGNSKIQSEHDVSILTSGSNADVKVQATGTNSKVRVSGTGGIELTSDVDAQADLLVGGNLTVTGNVISNGTQFTVNSTTVTTADNVIVLNKGEVGTGVTNNIAGLQIDRGSASDFQFVFDESIDKFKSGFVGGTFENIATETYVDASVNALATRVTAAENSGSSLDISMNLVESRLTTTETDINVLDTSMNAVESRLTTAESDINVLDTSMNAVESRLTTTESDIGSFDTSMNSVESRLTTTETNIGTLDTSMNLVESRLTSAESDIGSFDTSMNLVESRLTTAETNIGILDTSMNSVETRLTSAESDINVLDTSMNSVESRLTSAESDIGTLDTSMNSVESRLTTAETDIGTLDTSMNAVETRLTTAETDIGSFDTSMNSVESRLTTAESDIGTLDTSMNAVESRLTTTETDIGTLDTSMNSVETRLTSAESDINVLDTSMNAVESRLTTTETDINVLDTSMNSVETRLTSAESDIGTLDTSMNSVESRLTTTEADINALDTSMNSVESRLTTTEADINALDTSMNSVGTLIQTAIDDLVGNAGSGYDTLVELQNEIENNDLSLNEVFTNVATKVSKSGDTMTGDLTISKGSGNTKISLICPNNSLAGLYMAETYNSETSYYGGSIRYDSGANQLKLGTGNLSPVDALWIGRGETNVNVVGNINVGGDIALSGDNISSDDNQLNLYSYGNSIDSTGYIELRADWSKLAGKLIYFVTDTDGSNYGTTRMTIAQDGNINMTGNLTITNPNEITYKNQTLDARFVPKLTGDNRQVNWSEVGVRNFDVHFGDFNNNSTGTWADCIHFNTWGDGSGGRSNLLCLRKVGGFGMRIYQPTDATYQNTTDYTDYRDCVLADTNGNVAMTGNLMIESETLDPKLTLWSKNTGNTDPTIDLLRNSETFGADSQYDWRITNDGGTFKIQTQGTISGYTGLRTMLEFGATNAGLTLIENLNVNNSKEITYKDQTLDTRFVKVAGGTMTGNLTINDAYVGEWSNGNNYAIFCHQALKANPNDFAILQRGTGGTIINSKSGEVLDLRIDNATKMRINSSGNVGIGTDTPTSNLHISSGTSGDCVLTLEADTDNNNEGDTCYINFKQDLGKIWSSIYTTNNQLNIANTVGSGTGGIVFKTHNVDTPAGGHPEDNAIERMKIGETGNITMTGILNLRNDTNGDYLRFNGERSWLWYSTNSGGATDLRLKDEGNGKSWRYMTEDDTEWARWFFDNNLQNCKLEFLGGKILMSNNTEINYKGQTLDDRFVNVAGDTMTGDLTLDGGGLYSTRPSGGTNGFELTTSDTYSRIEMYGSTGSYIDFKSGGDGSQDYNLRIIGWSSYSQIISNRRLEIDAGTNSILLKSNVDITNSLTADKLKTNTSLHFTTTNLGALTGETAGTWTIGPYSTNNNLIFYYGSFSVGYLKEDVNVSDINFTGQHHNYGVSELIDETGFIVSSTGNYRNQMTNCDECNKYKITINESLPIVEYSQQINDTKVWGVISDKDDTNTVREQPFGIFVSLYEQAEEDRPLTINSLGEGAVWVSNINGPIKNGDYITTCVLPGLGMKQDDDILHSYTVAKITTDCSFDEMDMVPRKSLKYETVSKTREISKEVEKDVFDYWIDDYEVETYYENVEQQIVDKIIKTIQEEIITYDASGIPNVQIIEKTIEEEVPRVKQMESTDASGNNIITEVPEMETVSVTKTRKIPKMINVTLKDVSNNDLLDSQGYPIIKQYQAKKAVYKKEIIQETITEVYDVSRAVVDPDTQQYVYDIKTDASGNTLYVEKYEMKYIVVSSDKYSVYNDKDHTELYKEFDGNFINVQINGESIIGKTYKMAFLGCTYHCG